jgi:hypothetical protein
MTIEQEIEEFIQKFQFRFNNEATHLEIKLGLQEILQARLLPIDTYYLEVGIDSVHIKEKE